MEITVIDTETAALEHDAVIFSIGAVRVNIAKKARNFDAFKKHCSEFYVTLNTTEQLVIYNRSVTKNTLQWWQQQPEHARRALLGEPMAMHHALLLLADFIKGTVFFRGPDFDGAKLEHAYQQTNKITGQKCPWHYNAKRDVRTYIDARMGTTDGYIKDLQKPVDVTPHNALDDALRDAWQMHLAYHNKTN